MAKRIIFIVFGLIMMLIFASLVGRRHHPNPKSTYWVTEYRLLVDHHPIPLQVMAPCFKMHLSGDSWIRFSL